MRIFALFLFSHISVFTAMELPSSGRVSSLKLLALKQVYAQDKKGRYSDKQRECIAKIIQEETVQSLVHDIVDGRLACGELEGELRAYASGIGLVLKTSFWSYSTFALVESPSGKVLFDFDPTEYTYIESPAISPDGRYCAGLIWDKWWVGKVFVVEVATGKKIFSRVRSDVGSIGFITNSCFFFGTHSHVTMVDLNNATPYTIINNQHSEQFGEVCAFNEEWIIAKGESRLFIYKKGNSALSWNFSKMLKTPKIKSIAMGRKKPIFAQVSWKRLKNKTAFVAAFYQIVEGAVWYVAACRVADDPLDIAPTTTFFDDDRYCACAVSLNRWFNPSQVMVIDLLAKGRPAVVQQIIVESQPRKLFSEGPILYAPSGIGSTHVLALNNWLSSQDKKSDSLPVAKNNALFQCSIV